MVKHVSDSVRQHDCSRIAVGLSSSISIGVPAAESGDTMESLTHRTVAAMYQHKKRRV